MRDSSAIKTASHWGCPSGVVRGDDAMDANTVTRSPLRREIGAAATMGHILFDPVDIAVGGPLEHWPTAARARAFAAMLLMPDEGVRPLLAGRGAATTADVRRVMARFGTGPYATTYHLKNRAFIHGEYARATLLAELVA